MTNSDPKPRHMHFAGIGQRLGSLATWVIFLYLVHLAVKGRIMPNLPICGLDQTPV
jgi:hypothetical protein